MNITLLLNQILPSGSGINGSWEFDVLKNGAILCHNFYEVMPYGSTIGYANFTVKIKMDHTGDLVVESLTYNDNRSRYLANHYDIAEYLDQLFFDAANFWDSCAYNASFNITQFYN